MASVFKLNSLATTNLLQIGTEPNIKCYGYSIVNTNAAARFVKLYWGSPGKWSSSGETPTIGTDVPAITIEVPALGTTTGMASAYWDRGIGNQGFLWMATTTTAPDNASTGVGAGDLLISIFFG